MARQLRDVLPPPEELLELPPEEVAGFLLDLLCETEEANPGRDNNINRYNFTLDGNIINYIGENEREKTRAVGKIVMEAWCWLENEGMLAPTRNEGSSEWRYVTKKGYRYRNKVDLDTYRKGHILPKENLDEKLSQNVYHLFLRGDYDTAVFQAYKEVEIRVRGKADLPDDLLGVNLMRRAFHPENGELTNKELLPAERQAISDLFSGGIGFFKNPSSHREVNLNNPSEAAEIILFANYLLKLVDRSQKNL